MTLPSPHLVSCVGVDLDLPLLSHFLEHYARLGIARDRMHIVLNALDPAAPTLTSARELLHEHGIEPAEIWIAPYTSDAMWAKRREVQQRLVAPEDWVISADVDEFHEYPEPLADLLRYCDERGFDCVQGPLIDRLAASGRLEPVRSSPPLADQFPIEADVAGVVRRDAVDSVAGTVKLLACRGSVLPSRGGHHPSADAGARRFLLGRPLATFSPARHAWFRFAVPFRAHHYKWTGGLLEATRRRLATPGVSVAGQEYGELLLAFFAAGDRSVLDAVPVRRRPGFDRVPWRWRVAALRGLAKAEQARGAMRRRRP